MPTRVDHVGYAARDLAEGVAAVQTTYGLEIAQELELPQFSVRAVLLSGGAVVVEVLEFLVPQLAQERLAGRAMRLDHIAYEVVDIDRAAARLRSLGVPLCAPDGTEVSRPLELAGARHLWTAPGQTLGIRLQLIERRADEARDDLRRGPLMAPTPLVPSARPGILEVSQRPVQ